MMNDDGLETVPYQTFNVIQIISSNNDHQLDENIEYFQNDIELISDFVCSFLLFSPLFIRSTLIDISY